MNKAIQQQINQCYLSGYLSHDDILALPECEHIELDSTGFYTPNDLESINAAKLADSELNRAHTMSIIHPSVLINLKEV